MKAVELKKGVYWVGGIDWNLRNFHGYLTQRGSTYNAYLIIDEKITLIDTVKYYLVDELKQRIASIIDPAKIDYVVSNHVEMDHSGGLPAVMEWCPNAQIITSPNGEKGLRQHYKKNWNFKVVKSGDSFSIGSRTLQFVLTPMVHWPDNMVAFCPEENILFSNDSFGQHIASSERFDDEYSLEIIKEEAAKYYANIVLPYGEQVKQEFAAVQGLDIRMIAPSHGIIWRSHIPDVLSWYQKWAFNETEKKALIIYDSMWNSTEKMAQSILAAFEEKGYATRLFNLRFSHISDIMTEVLTAEYICIGSPTLNNNMLPTVAGFLAYLRGLAPKGRKGLAFGSYGWGGQSIGQIDEILRGLKWDILDSMKYMYVPDQSALDEIRVKIETQLS